MQPRIQTSVSPLLGEWFSWITSDLHPLTSTTDDKTSLLFDLRINNTSAIMLATRVLRMQPTRQLFRAVPVRGLLALPSQAPSRLHRDRNQ